MPSVHAPTKQPPKDSGFLENNEDQKNPESIRRDNFANIKVHRIIVFTS